MKLSTEGLKNQQEWLEKGYHLPQYDRAAMIAETRENPVWVHFGAGNIFRAFQANLAQRLLEEGSAKAGITVCEGFDYEIVEKANKEQYWGIKNHHADIDYIQIPLTFKGYVMRQFVAMVDSHLWV